MARIGKRILAAFVDVGEESQQPSVAAKPAETVSPPIAPAMDERFAGYFDKLFGDANLPGPDYYEFSRMVGAMQAIADERARYAAAFAGLQVQGLDKGKLLSTADEYLRLLDNDLDQFRKTVDSALQEKVQSRSVEVEEKTRRIQTLSQEILDLQQQIGTLQKEISGNKEKLEASSSGYSVESGRRRRQIQTDIEKINHYL